MGFIYPLYAPLQWYDWRDRPNAGNSFLVSSHLLLKFKLREHSIAEVKANLSASGLEISLESFQFEEEHNSVVYRIDADPGSENSAMDSFGYSLLLICRMLKRIAESTTILALGQESAYSQEGLRDFVVFVTKLVNNQGAELVHIYVIADNGERTGFISGYAAPAEVLRFTQDLIAYLRKFE